jgi:hypothetical protein
LFLIRLWQPERQINLHTENLFRKIEQKNWTAVSDFIGADYSDEWADDRAILLTRMREVFCYLRNVRIAVVDPNVTVEQDHGIWRGKVTINGDGGEAMALSPKSALIRFQLRLNWSGAKSSASRGTGNWSAPAIQA